MSEFDSVAALRQVLEARLGPLACQIVPQV